MKSVVAGLVAVLFAGHAFAQSAPATAPAAPAPEAKEQEADTAHAAKPVEGQQVPTVPVQSQKPKNTTAIVLGAVGAAALLGAASNSGGGDDAPANPQPKPSSP